MDAKPHRRGLSHIHNDENAAPVTKQSLHQRHKSTGALYHNMSGATGLNAVAKRAAFGDVSNTSRALNHAKDDLVVSVKGNGTEYVKPQVLEKENALSRPAQRPLTATVKTTILGLNKANQSASLTTTSNKITAVPSVIPTQVVRPRASSKRITAIYKDENSAKPQQTLEPAKQQNIPVASVPIPPVHQTLGPRHHKSQPQLKLNQPVLRRTQSKYMHNVLPTVLSDAILPSSSSIVDFKDAPVAEEPKLPSVADNSYDYQSYDAPAQSVVKVDSIDTEPAVQTIDDYVPEERQLPALPSEPEEYWEEEEEVYDEQGYTTAHSYRSRGDNTTGGATTVMIPKLNTKVERELEAAKLIVEGSRTREEIEDDMWDTSMVAEYGDEIFGYMRELEIKLSPNPHYMDNQAEIQWSMRSVLMDWLIQVHHRFSLLPETLFLCVNYIDRFLSHKIVSLGKLQLVGATAIFVAAKYEEINCPSVSEIVYMVDDGYSVDEILKAERFMLGMLDFELGWPGPMSFLRRISKADDYDLETRTLAKYFLEVAIMDERFVGTPPSFVAAGAQCISRMMLKKGDWTPAHVHYSGYTWTQLRPLVSLMLECCRNPEKHHAAVFDKYSDRRYKRASEYVKTTITSGFKLPLALPDYSLPSRGMIGDSDGFMPYDSYSSPHGIYNNNNMVQVKG
ncbi:hypothetical protein V500_06925 [Pseudogymnoascus sp. VKM F-4518 (FW-2643)]|nr:hypothetical protein V500_06925 [Pseudogymnoascus sp. VKM F-4518 (FW-2643)]